MATRDVWTQMESNLNVLLGAGLQLLGDLPKPEFHGGPGKAQVIAQAKRDEEIRRWAKSWGRQE